MYKILINIITKNKDKWIFYQEDGADYIASSLDDIKDKALELLDEYGEDNVKIVDQRSGDDSKKDIPTYLFGNGTGGTSDYNELENKPKINGVELINNKSLKDLGIIIPSNEDFTLEGLGEKSYNSLDDKPKIPKKVSELENDSKYETVESTDTKIAGAKSYADEAVAHLVGSAPETLDTLEEVAKAIQDNETVVDALNAAIGSKADKTELGTKQDKLTAGDGIDIKDNIISADNNVEFFYNFTTVEAMQKVIDSMRAGKKAMLISKGNNAANKGYGMFEYPIFYSPDVSNIDWDTYSGVLYFKSDWWMDSYTDVFHGNEIKLIPKWQYITVSILPGGIVKSVNTNNWSSHNNIPNVMSSLNVLGKTNEVEYTPTKDYHPATKKYVDDNKYILPTATTDTLGGIKIGDGLSVDENGVVSASGCDIPVYNFKMTSEYRKATSTVTYVYMSSSDKTTLQNIIQDAYDKGLETFALFVNQRVGTYTGTNEMHQDYLLTIVNGKLIKNKPRSLLLAGYSQGNSTLTDVYLSKLNISLPLSWNEDSCTVGTTTYINIELRPLSSDNTIMYVPTSDYNPATKKYVDDAVATKQDILTYSMYLDGSNVTDTEKLQVASDLINNLYKSGSNNSFILHNLYSDIFTSDSYDSNLFMNGAYPITNTKGTFKFMSINNSTTNDYEPCIRGHILYIYGTWTNDVFTANRMSLIRSTHDLSLNKLNSSFLNRNNTTSYTPTGDYNPATKKYVDDQVGNINTVLATLTTVSEVTK